METIFISIVHRLAGRREDIGRGHGTDAGRNAGRPHDAVAGTGWAALTGCTGPAHPHATAVVASTDVWGSVARAVAGGHVAVASILSGSDQDPHSYEASPSDAAAIADAGLVVFNGGGYDGWVDDVLAHHPGVARVDAYALLPDDGRPRNEHVFYHLGVAKAVAAAVADRLGNAADYRRNAAAFGRDADAIAGTARSSPPSRSPSTCSRRRAW